MQVSGVERYNPVLVPRIARLPVGSIYDRERILQAQLRLASSGYFDSAFILVDPQSDPEAAPVQVTVREAPLQKVVLGVGLTTDSGPRVSIEHIHNRVPGIGWRAVSKLQLDRKSPFVQTELTGDPRRIGLALGGPGARRAPGRRQPGHARPAAALRAAAQRGAHRPQRVRAVRPRHRADDRRRARDVRRQRRGLGAERELRVDRPLLRQPDVSHARPWPRPGARWRRDARRRPQRVPAHGVPRLVLAATDAGPAAIARRSRRRDRALRREAARPRSCSAPAATPRCAATRSARSALRLPGGQTGPGRYMAVGSVEWQKPIRWGGRPTEFEGVAFVDAGGVADRVGDIRLSTGVGAGVRWRSPVGPVQADLAYGVKSKKRAAAHERGVRVLKTRLRQSRMATDSHAAARGDRDRAVGGRGPVVVGRHRELPAVGPAAGGAVATAHRRRHERDAAHRPERAPPGLGERRPEDRSRGRGTGLAAAVPLRRHREAGPRAGIGAAHHRSPPAIQRAVQAPRCAGDPARRGTRRPADRAGGMDHATRPFARKTSRAATGSTAMPTGCGWTTCAGPVAAIGRRQAWARAARSRWTRRSRARSRRLCRGGLRRSRWNSPRRCAGRWRTCRRARRWQPPPRARRQRKPRPAHA